MKKIKLNIQMFASTNKTTNYELPQFIGTDKPSWLGDVNGAMSAIDTAMHTNATTIAGVQSTIQTLSASLDATNQSVTSLSNSLDTLDGRVTTQGGTITSIDGRVTTLENDNSINKAKIETNSTYSTDEIKVGKWIDDKPIYRKVIAYTGTKSNFIEIPHNITNLATITNIHGIMGGRPLCSAYGATGTLNTSNYFAFIYVVDTTNIEVSLSDYFVSAASPIYITIEYTKTTD